MTSEKCPKKRFKNSLLNKLFCILENEELYIGISGCIQLFQKYKKKINANFYCRKLLCFFFIFYVLYFLYSHNGRFSSYSSLLIINSLHNSLNNCFFFSNIYCIYVYIHLLFILLLFIMFHISLHL